MKRGVAVFFAVAAGALVFAAAAWALRFTDESYFPPVGVVGSPYSFAFGGAGGCGPALPYQFSVISGSLPPGLTLASSGQVSGTPTQAGGWSFWVNLSDQNPPSENWCRPAEAQREFTITINSSGGVSPPPPPPPPPAATVSITTTSLPGASVGSPYSFTFAASSSATPSWIVAAGSLPAGVSLASNGVLSGTPQAAGTASFTVKASAGGAESQKQFTLEVTPALAIGAPDNPVGEVALPLTIALNAMGGTAPYRWELKQGALPTHVGFIGDQGNGSAAVIKGVPADSGTFTLVYTVTDVRGRTTEHTLTLRVADKLRVVAMHMPRFGHVGKPYRAHAIVQGGFGADTWSIAKGALPAGLKLDPSAGFISGKPGHRGRYVVYLAAKDELGASRSLKLNIIVRP